MSQHVSYRTVRVDGLSIFYGETGAKNAPTILLLYGLPSPSRMFEPIFARLSDRYPDYPGKLPRHTIRDGSRASEVITRLRSLDSKKEPSPEAMDMNDATREVTALSLSELQNSGLTLRCELAGDLPPVVGRSLIAHIASATFQSKFKMTCRKLDVGHKNKAFLTSISMHLERLRLDQT